jgi:hypothetical protein
MFKGWSALFLLLCFLGITSTVSAQARVSAFAVNCMGPVHARLAASILFDNKTLHFTNTCRGAGGPAESPFPSVLNAYGEVRSVSINVEVTELASNAVPRYCTAVSQEGFLQLRCKADAQAIRAVDILISIPHPTTQ